jgi:hypothetical protein
MVFGFLSSHKLADGLLTHPHCSQVSTVHAIPSSQLFVVNTHPLTLSHDALLQEFGATQEIAV